MDCRIAGAKGYGDFHFNFTRLSHERDHRQMREWWIFSFLSQNVKLYHGVQRGARNGIDTSDWIDLLFLRGFGYQRKPLRLFECCNIQINIQLIPE